MIGHILRLKQTYEGGCSTPIPAGEYLIVDTFQTSIGGLLLFVKICGSEKGVINYASLKSLSHTIVGGEQLKVEDFL